MRKIVMLSLFAIIANSAMAQKTSTPSFGLKIGANYANVYDTKGEQFNADGKSGLAGGVFVGIPFGKTIGIQPEILYSERGFKATGSLLGSPYTITRTTSYVDIPLMLAIKPSSFLTLLVGPQYSFLVKEKNVFATSTTSVLQEQAFKNDNVRKNTLCITGGLDLNLQKVVIGARAGWDLQNNNGDGTTTTPQYRNVWYQASIGFRIL